MSAYDPYYRYQNEYQHRLEEMERYFREKISEMEHHIDYLQQQIHYERAPEETLERMDIKDVEKFLRKKKLEKINGKKIQS
jgi:Uri superfamily endonuclease